MLLKGPMLPALRARVDSSLLFGEVEPVFAAEPRQRDGRDDPREQSVHDDVGDAARQHHASRLVDDIQPHRKAAVDWALVSARAARSRAANEHRCTSSKGTDARAAREQRTRREGKAKGSDTGRERARERTH